MKQLATLYIFQELDTSLKLKEEPIFVEYDYPTGTYFQIIDDGWKSRLEDEGILNYEYSDENCSKYFGVSFWISQHEDKTYAERVIKKCIDEYLDNEERDAEEEIKALSRRIERLKLYRKNLEVN